MNRRKMTLAARAFAIAGMLVLSAVSVVAAVDPITNWNTIAVQASLTAAQSQGAVASRTLAIVHVAIHDALNAIDSRYERYAFTGNAATGASVDAAVAAASHDALVGAIDVGALPFTGFGTPATQALALAQVDAAYQTALAQIPDGPAKSAGIAVGQAAAAAIVALRNTDHATTLVTYTPGTEPGDWQPTPNPVPFDPPAAADHLPASLPGWGKVTPFVLHRSSQFEPKGPPALSSAQYAADYNEVKAIGAKDSTIRSAEQTSIARFWYEGSPFGWSRIAGVAADSQGLDLWERARLLALVNMAMADGFIAGMEAKYTYNFWRPVTAIRAGDTDGITRSYASFSQARTENGESRIYAGIHFRSAVEDGIQQGEKIGHFVFEHALRPAH